MKKIALFLLTASLLLFSLQSTETARGLGELSLQSFARLFREQTAREVFDVEEEEARAVFQDGGEAVFL